MFDLSVREAGSQRVAAWLPALAGLIAAACVAWLTCPAPAPNSLSQDLFSMSGVAALATRYVLLSAVTGLAVSVGCNAMLLRGSPPGARVFNLRVMAAMVWLPPLALFLSQRSIWAGMAAVLFGWHLAKSRSSPARTFDQRAATASSELFQTFRTVDSFPWVPSLEALCSAVCAQSGALTGLYGWPVAAAALWGIGSALAAWSSNRQRAAIEAKCGEAKSGETESGDSSAPARRVLLVLAFAILFAVAGLMQYIRGGAGDEVAGSGRSSAGQDQARAKDSTGPLDGIYRGVILLTEPAPHAALVPPLPFMRHDLFSEKQPTPLSVPFFGVYWMFRWPQTQPPPGSYVTRGSPLDSVFRSSDHFALSMEAHQNFGTLIDLSCCSKIQLAIRSADPNSVFIALELILTNTTSPGRSSLSLGKATIASALDRLPDDYAPPVQRILSFDVPRFPEIREFDEATIVFHRVFPTASAKVAIDRFVFVPRGLEIQ